MNIPNPSRANRRNNEGIAVIVMLALLGLILGFIFANLSALSDLHGELQVIERKQIRRLDQSITNAPPASPAATATNSPVAQITKPFSE